jgi:beta-lactam-binding protein with PASTA domain
VPTPPPSTDVTIPDVYGLPERDAWQRLTNLGLTVTESQVGTASQCYVIDQTPGAGSVVAVGSTVHIVVAIQLGPFCGVA